MADQKPGGSGGTPTKVKVHLTAKEVTVNLTAKPLTVRKPTVQAK